jgi:hypothetical protein
MIYAVRPFFNIWRDDNRWLLMSKRIVWCSTYVIVGGGGLRGLKCLYFSTPRNAFRAGFFWIVINQRFRGSIHKA